MKKIALILLISVYAVSVLGVGIESFYCCGKLTSVTVTFSQNTSQNCEKGDEKGGCCQSKYQVLKIKDNHIAADQISNPAKYFAEAVLFTPSFHSVGLAVKQIRIVNPANGPPIHPGTPDYVFNCVFRI